MKEKVIFLACALALSGCTNQAIRDRLDIQDPTILQRGLDVQQSAAAGAVNREWIDTYASLNDRDAALQTLQQHLNDLPQDASPYFRAKAQCWIDVAREERAAHDRWGFVDEALGQAALITTSLANGKKLSAANPELRTVSVVRTDLWAAVHAMKSDPATPRCPDAQQSLACGEVGLMRAGHHAWIRDFDGADKLLPYVEAHLTKARQAMTQCDVGTPVTTPSVSVEPLPPKLTLGADSLFRFDASDQRAMAPAGKAALDKLVERLKLAPDVRALTIDGFTDRLGSDAHNRQLSIARAQTVRDYLKQRSVALPMNLHGYGPAKPVVQCRQKSRDALVQCLAPNRRVEISVERSAH